MAKIVKKVKRPLGGFKSFSSGGSAAETSALRPVQVIKTPPCSNDCPNQTDIREFLTAISWAEDLGISKEASFENAWNIFVEKNPFPSTTGRVCPHTCEDECNRNHKDGAVGINDLERFIGDFSIQKEFKFKKSGETFAQKVAVIGAGPDGLSCAYQLARKGYKVKVYETSAKSGGMLQYNIPDYRLPKDILNKEIKRIEELGVEFLCNKKYGKDYQLEDLQKDFDAVIVGEGAHRRRLLKQLNVVEENSKVFLVAGNETPAEAENSVETAETDESTVKNVDIQVDKNAVSEYVTSGLNIQTDVIEKCPSKSMEWNGTEITIDNKTCRMCMKCIKIMPKALSAGKDAVESGQVTISIYNGRKTAEEIHNRLQNIKPQTEDKPAVITHDKMILSYYESKKRNEILRLDDQASVNLTEEQVLDEAKRCMSCGNCFDCGTCWSYCQDQVIVKPLVKHQPYKYKLEFCKGCNKCAEACPCGYIEMN